MSSVARMRAHLFLALLVCASQNAHACRRPPEEQLASPDQLLARVNDVSVARVVSAVQLDAREVEYRFVVTRRIAGPAVETFSVFGSAALPGEVTRRGDEADHAGPRFWVRGGGRTMNDSDCRIHPAFAVGETYLVMLDQPWTWRSFEHIPGGVGGYNVNDKWLRYVEFKLGARDTGG